MKIGIPSGSLYQQTINILNSVGYDIKVQSERNYQILSSSDFNFILVKPNEIPSLVQNQILDCALCGLDILIEQNYFHYDFSNHNLIPHERIKFKIFDSFIYSKKTNQESKYIIAVPKNSYIQNINQLNNKIIAAEKTKILEDYLEYKNINAKIIKSFGKTENKIHQGLCDAIFDIMETGESIFENDLKIVTSVLNTNVVLIGKERNNDINNLIQNIHYGLKQPQKFVQIEIVALEDFSELKEIYQNLSNIIKIFLTSEQKFYIYPFDLKKIIPILNLYKEKFKYKNLDFNFIISEPQLYKVI